MNPQATGFPAPIFIGGAPRSGTTLLRVILDTHPRIYCGTELRVIQALANLSVSAERSAGRILESAYGVPPERLLEIFAELITAFLRPAWQASGKARVAEKTPWNLLAFPQLHRLFPRSPLIHVIRDPRDVVASRLQRDRTSADGKPVDTLALARQRAREWVDAMAIRRQMRSDAQLASRYFELRYEQLVRTPEPVLRELFAFLEEDFDPAVLDFHRSRREVAGSEEWSAEAVQRPIFESSIGRWRHDLTETEQSAVISIAGGVMKDLGYSVNGNPHE
jgi:hypothetical protein